MTRTPLLFRALLLLYPRAFAQRYAESMEQLYADLAREGDATSTFAWRMAFDLLLGAGQAWRAELADARPSRAVRAGLVVIVVLVVLAPTLRGHASEWIEQANWYANHPEEAAGARWSATLHERAVELRGDPDRALERAGVATTAATTAMLLRNNPVDADDVRERVAEAAAALAAIEDTRDANVLWFRQTFCLFDDSLCESPKATVLVALEPDSGQAWLWAAAQADNAAERERLLAGAAAASSWRYDVDAFARVVDKALTLPEEPADMGSPARDFIRKETLKSRADLVRVGFKRACGESESEHCRRIAERLRGG